MQKKEFKEMLAINKALGGKYSTILRQIDIDLAMGLMEEDFTEDTLMDYMVELGIKLNGIFVSNSTLNKRKLATDKIIALFTNEIEKGNYTIKVKKFLGKEEEMDSILVPLLKKIKSNITNPMLFEDLVASIVTTTKEFGKKGGGAQDYIDGLKNYQWNDAYKDRTKLKEPDWAEIYNTNNKKKDSIVGVYTSDYVLTETAYNDGITEWINGTIAAVQNASYKEYELDVNELYNLNKKYFDSLPKLFDVYKDLKKSTLAFFERDALIKNGAVLIDEETERKYVTLTSVQACIEKNFKVAIPTIKEKDRITIKSNQLIPETLEAGNGFKWLAEAIGNSIEENSPLYMEDALSKILDKNLDDDNIKQQAKLALTGWYEKVYELLGEIDQNNIPQVNEIKKDISKIFESYTSISGDVCSNISNKIIKVLESQNWENLNTLSQNVQDSVFSNNLEYDLRDLLPLWWKYFDGNFNNIEASSMATACLPAPAKIREVFKRNTCSMSKQMLIDGVEEWKASMLNPFVNAAASLSNFKDIGETTFSGTKLKDEYWGYLFAEDDRLVYFKDTVCAEISDNDSFTAAELDAEWNKGIMAINAESFWEEHLFKAYIDKNEDVSILESWERSKHFLLPSEKSFVPLLIKLLLKLPVRKRSKTPKKPALSNQTLNGYIEQFDKWNEIFSTQYELLGQLLQRYYHVFEIVSDTHSDVKRDFDLFLNECNSDLDAAYDNSWLSGTLGNIAKVAVVGVVAIVVGPELIALGALATATGAAVASDVVSGTVEYFTHKPTKYNQNIQSIFTTATNVTGNIYDFAKAIKVNVQEADASIFRVHRILTGLKIANLQLTPEIQVLLDEIDAKTAIFFDSLVKYMSDLEAEIDKVKLSNLDWAFEGFVLRDFILANVEDEDSDILLSQTFVEKARAYNFCLDSDFVDTYWPGESWEEDVDRLRSNATAFNPILFK